MKKTTILSQLIFTVVIPVIIILFLMTFVTFKRTRNLFNKLNTNIERTISDEIVHAISLQEISLQGLEKGINQHLKSLSNKIVDLYDKKEINLEETNLRELRRQLGMDFKNEDIYIIDKNGIVVNTTFPKDLGLNFFNFGESHKQFLLGLFKSKGFHNEGFGIESSTMRLKKYSYQTTSDGLFIVELGTYSSKADEIIDFNNLLLNRISLSNEGIASADLYFVADNPFSFSRWTRITDKDKEMIKLVYTNKNDTTILSSNKNEFYAFHYIWIPRKEGRLYKGAVLRIKEDLDYETEFFNSELIYSISTVLFICFILGLSLTIIIKKKISIPVQHINNLLQSLSKGEIKTVNSIHFSSSNEIGEIVSSANALSIALKNITKFSGQIKKGLLDADLQELGPKDELGTSLISMRDSIKENRKMQSLHREEENKRAWVNNGIANINDIVTKNNNDIKTLSDLALKELVKYLNVAQGAIFYHHSNEDGEYLELYSAFAYERKKHIDKRIVVGEGLIGACAYERQTTYLNDVPSDYIEIKSGMGEAPPRAIVLVPIMTELHFVGVIELASFSEIPKHHIELVEKISENLAIAVNNAMIHSKTSEVIKENKQYKERIKELEEELVELQADIISQKEI